MKMHIPAPEIGAVLWARLPEEGGDAKAKLRPVVVLDVFSLNGLTYVTVAKGTSKHTDDVYLGEFVVRSPADLACCGLNQATKFQLQRREKLPLTEAWFSMGKSITMPRHLLQRLVAAAQEIRLI